MQVSNESHFNISMQVDCCRPHPSTFTVHLARRPMEVRKGDKGELLVGREMNVCGGNE